MHELQDEKGLQTPLQQLLSDLLSPVDFLPVEEHSSRLQQSIWVKFAHTDSTPGNIASVRMIIASMELNNFNRANLRFL
jgi:hypothetical protein